jgi:hypothetical protein
MSTFQRKVSLPAGVAAPAPPVAYSWWLKWTFVSVCAVLVCIGMCWTGGAKECAEMLRDWKQKVRDKRKEKEAEARRSASAGGAARSSDPPSVPSGPAPLQSTGEAETKAALEHLLGKPFIKVRPAWLRNTVHMTGRNLEIDCFNEELGIAVERNGVQHSVYPNVFHKTLEEFTAQVQRDVLKRQVCEARGLVFIVVPHTVQRKDIEAFLHRELIQRGVLQKGKVVDRTRRPGPGGA